MKTYRIRFQGQMYELEVEEVSGVEKEMAQEKKTTQETPPAQKANDKVSGVDGKSVVAPMPGTILQVNVQVGDSVKAGQVLVILEAMKMENEIVAPVNGTVTTVQVAKGSQVGAGDCLIILG